VDPRTLDHVAFWTDARDEIAEFALAHLGMHVIERTERFTLIGSDARRGKLTLFAAEGPREPGALEHVALRVTSLDEAERALPEGLRLERPRPGELLFDAPGGLRLGLVESPADVEYDLDHAALRTRDPEQTARDYLRLGFEPASDDGRTRVAVGGAFVVFPTGDPGRPERPLLNHLAVLVDSADEHLDEARELGVEVDDVVDAPNTYAVFLRGPDGVRVEYVEHKPSFSLT
jgi:catechol 2,3-dioxygenase-like lactoylglutathione lyase family enzyme